MIFKVKKRQNYSFIKIIENNPILNLKRSKVLISIIFSFFSIKDKINFKQLERYGDFSEKTYRTHFEIVFDFLNFNKELILKHSSNQRVIAFDPSYIPKSGKHTPGCGKYWSGCANASKFGLEIGGIGVIDKSNHTCFHLEGVQTANKEELKEFKKVKGNSRKDSCKLKYTLIDYYIDIIVERIGTLLEISNQIVVDSYFSKKNFIDSMWENGLDVISRFRDDVHLRELYTGEKRESGSGRQKVYGDKVDLKNINTDYFELVSDQDGQKIYTAIVNAKALKRNVRVVLVENKKAKYNYKVFFATKTNLDAKDILETYKLRFQIEFVYRDAKQHTGLNDCQARSKNKLYTHFNLALTTINIAKTEHWLNTPKEQRGAFSMRNIKTMYHNALLLEKFFLMIPKSRNIKLKDDQYRELITYGEIAA
jgi:hypothetical protein